MENWSFKREESFEVIPAMDVRVRIDKVEKLKSQNGNDMLKLTLSVNGFKAKLFHYVVFLPDNPSVTNRNLTAIFDSFGIADGDFNTSNWAGKVGACHTKLEKYEGEDRTKVAYFIKKDKQKELPEWKSDNGAMPSPSTTTVNGVKVVNVDKEDLPF